MPIIIIAAVLICIVLLPGVISVVFPFIAGFFALAFADTDWYLWVFLIVAAVFVHMNLSQNQISADYRV